jgi:hypothetical protein
MENNKKCDTENCSNDSCYIISIKSNDFKVCASCADDLINYLNSVNINYTERFKNDKKD